ncbi:MAG TPA: hypothetical protein VE618_01430 [Myxococcaceae bacterium]|jgi:hypothetical protein|nr:hypothetical protein [Myxococcaceae bacterium]
MRTLLVTILCVAFLGAGGCATAPEPAPTRRRPPPAAPPQEPARPDGNAPSGSDSKLSEGEGFQKTRWGMGPADVKRLYPSARASRTARSDLEVPEVSFVGEPAQIEFTFDTGLLSQVKVNLKSEGLERDQMLQRCFRFHELLTQKYGEPPNSELRWKADREQSADAIGSGQFALGGEWVTPTTVVALKCERVGGAIVTRVEYSDKRLTQREDDAALEDL